jgi:hypothetical protein
LYQSLDKSEIDSVVYESECGKQELIMSEEPSSQSVEPLADYLTDEVELYYYFWVMPNSTSWYQGVEEDIKETSNQVFRRNSFSLLSMILLSSCLLLGLMALIRWHNQRQYPRF